MYSLLETGIEAETKLRSKSWFSKLNFIKRLLLLKDVWMDFLGPIKSAEYFLYFCEIRIIPKPTHDCFTDSWLRKSMNRELYHHPGQQLQTCALIKKAQHGVRVTLKQQLVLNDSTSIHSRAAHSHLLLASSFFTWKHFPFFDPQVIMATLTKVKDDVLCPKVERLRSGHMEKKVYRSKYVCHV